MLPQKMAQRLRAAMAALAYITRVQFPAPKCQVTTICNFSYRGSNALFSRHGYQAETW